MHIGTYLMNLVVSWALNLGVDAVVDPINLIEGDARSCSARDRRNRMYEQFGMRFLYQSGTRIERAAGRSVPDLRLVELQSLDAVEGVTEQRLEEHLTQAAMDAYTAKQEAAKNQCALECTQDWYREQERERSARWHVGLKVAIGSGAAAALWLLASLI